MCLYMFKILFLKNKILYTCLCLCFFLVFMYVYKILFLKNKILYACLCLCFFSVYVYKILFLKNKVLYICLALCVCICLRSYFWKIRSYTHVSAYVFVYV